jgi:hypothetical protein
MGFASVVIYSALSPSLGVEQKTRSKLQRDEYVRFASLLSRNEAEANYESV